MKRLVPGLTGAGLLLTIAAHTGPADFQTPSYAVSFSRSAPAFTRFSVDGLGEGKLDRNPVLPSVTNLTGAPLEVRGNGDFAYPSPTGGGWRIRCSPRVIQLRCDFAPNALLAPLVLLFDQKTSHPTLLGLMPPGARRMALPCVLHLPDRGSVRIGGNVPGGTLGYDARRFVPTPFVRVEFPPATATHPRVEYRLEVVAIYPRLPGIEGDPRFDGFRRGYLNIFQVNPRVRALANNASSDPVAFTLFEYADVALETPPLAEGLTCLDLVRMTLERYLDGMKGYGLVGYGTPPTEADLIPWGAPWDSLDSYPSLLIAACDYIQGTGDWAWARRYYGQLTNWAGVMRAADRDGNGLLEYPGTGNRGDRPTPTRRPANWWDTINFGHEDAYANALAYRAWERLSAVARHLGQGADAERLSRLADRLRAAYLPTFLDPQTGVLAGWKSADGQLHDYWFTFVNSVAISYGLVDRPEANRLLDNLMKQLRAVNYTNFQFGLPGNLVPVPKADYTRHNWPGALEVGEPSRDDGSDAFQRYENGGATGCFAYFTVHALYQLGRVGEARQIFYPMLANYAAGEFQGFGPNGKSKDWRDWQGGCHGYEGLLVDNYLTLLAVLDEAKARWR